MKIHLLITSLTLIWSGSECLIIPKDLQMSIHPIQPHEMRCTMGMPIRQNSNITCQYLQSESPVKNEHMVVGYLCSKFQWTGRCIWGPFHNSYEGTTVPLKPSEYECITAIEDHVKGQLQEPPKERGVCSLFAGGEYQVKFMTVVEKEVTLNHYNLEYIDPIFKNGLCKSSMCETYYANTLWLDIKERNSTCHQLESTPLKICQTSSNMTVDDIWISSTYIPLTSLKDSCYGFNYCGRKYYMTKSSHIFNFSSQFSGMTQCDSNRRVSLSSESTSSLNAEGQIMQMILYDRCMDSLEKLKRGRMVSRFDLTFFRPHLPGVGTGYFIKGGGIYVGTVEYVDVLNITVNCNTRKKCMLLGTKDGSAFKLKVPPQFCNETYGLSCDIGNGVTITNSTLVDPQSLETEAMEDLIVEEKLIPKYDPMIPPSRTSDVLTPDSVPVPPTNTKGGLFNWVEDEWKSFEGWLTTTLIIVGVIFIIFICIYQGWLCNLTKFCCLNKEKSRHAFDKPDSIEMNHLRSSGW